MCGIIGAISYNGTFFLNQNELRSAASFLKYRGPDDEGELFFESGPAKICFAHRRLSVIDLSPFGRQPMTSVSGRSVIVFNGEIYNYQLLKAELENRHFRFKTKSDTEVLLNGFECWGIEELLNKLDGMFAFALFDRVSGSLFLARDRFGKKPLYYHCSNNQLAFSSDIRGFKKINNIKLSLDISSLGYYFGELSTPHQSTIWNEIKKVIPGSFLQFDRSGIVSFKEYYKPHYIQTCELTHDDIAMETDRLLTLAVKKRLVSDVRVSALLSGGIDSSLVVAKMAEQASGRVKTYSVGFKEDHFNELPFAAQVAEKFNTDHTELIVEPATLQNIEWLIAEFGEPFADSSMVPTYLMAREIARSEKVVLGGDGGDELFGGYHSHYFAYWYDRVKWLSIMYPGINQLSKIFLSYRVGFLNKLLAQCKKPTHTLMNRNLGFDTEELKALFNNEIFYSSVDAEHNYIWNTYSPHSTSNLINLLSASLKTRLVNDYLVKVDRACMSVSLEMRSPFLDKDLAYFAATLKPVQLFYKIGAKSILKRIAENYFSKEFVHRSKMGFSIPLGDWFRMELETVLKETVLGGKQKLVDLDYLYIEQLINEHIQGIADHTHKLWSLYVFHIWVNNQ